MPAAPIASSFHSQGTRSCRGCWVSRPGQRAFSLNIGNFIEQRAAAIDCPLTSLTSKMRSCPRRTRHHRPYVAAIATSVDDRDGTDDPRSSARAAGNDLVTGATSMDGQPTPARFLSSWMCSSGGPFGTKLGVRHVKQSSALCRHSSCNGRWSCGSPSVACLGQLRGSNRNSSHLIQDLHSR
jgi:hypothetical protein